MTDQEKITELLTALKFVYYYTVRDQCKSADQFFILSTLSKLLTAYGITKIGGKEETSFDLPSI